MMLKDYGYQPVFLTHTGGSSKFDDSIETVRLPADSVPQWTRKSGQWLMDNRSNIDLIYVIDLFYQAITDQLLYLNRIGLPTVIKLPTLGYIPRLIMGSELRSGFASLDAYIALSKGIESELISVGIQRERIHAIPNGVDPEEFAPTINKADLRLKLELPPDRVLILFAGRFAARKRVDVLLKAIRFLPSEAHLVLVGPGLSEIGTTVISELSSLIDERKATVRDATDDVLPYYQASDINVLLSEREGMPNAVLEGMSCGLPTVASSIPGITDIMTDGCEGMLVPVGDAKAAARALHALVVNSDLRQSMGQSARRRIERNFDLSTICQVYVQLFEQMKRKKGGFHEDRSGHTI